MAFHTARSLNHVNITAAFGPASFESRVLVALQREDAGEITIEVGDNADAILTLFNQIVTKYKGELEVAWKDELKDTLLWRKVF
jgi:hypothetical protein